MLTLRIFTAGLMTMDAPVHLLRLIFTILLVIIILLNQSVTTCSFFVAALTTSGFSHFTGENIGSCLSVLAVLAGSPTVLSHVVQVG